jgi:DNA-binding LacI/PurR family transcriptional regulator
VSRVINDKPTIASGTRHVVSALMKKLGYGSDPMAREFSGRTSQPLGNWMF